MHIQRSLGYCKSVKRFFTLSRVPTPNHHPVAVVCSMHHVGFAARWKRISVGGLGGYCELDVPMAASVLGFQKRWRVQWCLEGGKAS